jgi:hypothetical protein
METHRPDDGGSKHIRNVCQLVDLPQKAVIFSYTIYKSYLDNYHLKRLTTLAVFLR